MKVKVKSNNKTDYKRSIDNVTKIGIQSYN